MTLPGALQRELDRFFQMGHFEKSTMGPMLERAELFSVRPKPDPELVRARLEREPWEPPVGEITARPTAETRIDTKGEPDTSELVLIGRVTRTLSMLRPRHRRALEAFFGDLGACCAGQPDEHPCGRIACLFTLTAQGLTIVRRERKASKVAGRMTPLEIIENALASKKHPTDNLAIVQALELKEAAEAAYTEASHKLREARGRL